jgi:flagellar assembly protein FliH
MFRSQTLPASTANGAAPAPAAFLYPCAPEGEAVNGSKRVKKLPSNAIPRPPAPLRSAKDRYSDEQVQALVTEREKKAREQGFQEAEIRLRAECESALEQERQRVGKAVEEFARERRAYFERAETEVVQLALSVARKILDREAHVDPLFLSGAVKVALGRVIHRSSARLRVAENELFKWRRAVSSLQDLESKPEVVGDPALEPGRCVIETDVGSAEISLEGQLREIEKGLLDLAALQPGR